MKARFFVAAGVALLAAQPAAAQANSCPTPNGNPATVEGARANAAADVCRQVVDVFQLLAPQLGGLITGGNATLGQGGSLGGLGHFSLGLRVNAIDGDIPDIDNFPTPRTGTSQPAQTLRTENQPLPLPTVDAAIGLFKGIPLGLTNVGGIDLLVSATYVPKLEEDAVAIEPESNLKFGFGARVSLLQESIVIPGVSFTYLKRDLPTTTIRGGSASDDIDFSITDLDVKTTAWRVVANKNLLFLGLAAGYGQDKYDQSTTVSGNVRNISVTPFPGTYNATFGPTAVAQELTRTNMFLDVSLNLPLFKLIGEVGQISGGDAATFNSFASDDNQAYEVTKTRRYASVGLRLAF